MTGAPTYIVGAGLNKAVRNWDGQSPPLAYDFFQILLGMRKFSDPQSPIQQRLSAVFDYVHRYWRLTRDRLRTEPFDLEDCFTLLDLQLVEAVQRHDDTAASHLRDVTFILKSAFAETLSEFSYHFSPAMYDFGRLLWSQRPTIISFNYDTCLEQALETGSGVRTSGHPARLGGGLNRSEYSDEDLLYSHCNWNRPLAYGCRFDVVKLQQAGVSQYVDGERFYSVPGNALYDWPLLKLHGSLNWFRYLPFRRLPAFDGIETLPAHKLESALLIDGHWWFGEPPDFEGWYIDPILVTPVLYKERYLSEPLYRRILQPLWQRASEILRTTTQLVVIGYSFPRTDFHVEKMFREAFADHDLERVIIVNPDREVDRKVRALTHYRGGLETYDDLPSFLRASGAAMLSEAMADWPQRVSGN